MPRILNQRTNFIENIDFQPTIGKLIAYYGEDSTNWIEIPDDGKIYEPMETPPYYKEKTVSLEEYRQELFETVNNLKKTPFSITIKDINTESESYYLDLQDSTILKLLVLVKKAEIMGQTSDEFINSETGITEYKTFTLEAIQDVQTEIIQKDDFLKLKANQIRKAQTIEDLQTIEQELGTF